MDDLNDETSVDDQSQSQNSQTVKILASGPLPSCLSNLSSSSKTIPSSQDFHFFYNFNEFKLPIQHIAAKSQSLLNKIGDSSHIWGKSLPYPYAADADDDIAYDWLVNVNDEIFERFDVSGDDFVRMRKKEEEIGKPLTGMSDDGFKVVYGKKKTRAAAMEANGAVGRGGGSGEAGAKMAVRDKKGRVSFHIPTIRKPQEEYNILVNNANQQFEHVWLERSEDGTRFIHPLGKLSVLDFVDEDIGNVAPMEPPPIETTPFTLVQEVKDLKELAAKLRAVKEFAVDLEHNQYRSFQGLTCLMQISTRTEDFVVDTLKLRIHVGPYLREIFKDPTKRKVMHGADRDIIWLQRDFGIYVCNLFDTGQASRVLKLERNSLEYLLHHFCGITANKEYQNADWRLRPLPDEMLRYAREDTHSLLYIYDLMRIKLSSMPKESESCDAPLVEVYKRSYDVCMQLYQKEIFTENSFLHIYGLPTTFNAQQLAIVSGLCGWRDIVARAEDESTGYILPNKTLLEIAKQMPLSTTKLRQLVKSKHSYVERNLACVVSVIRNSIQNAAAFEAVAEQLKSGPPEMASQENNDETEGFPLENSIIEDARKHNVHGDNDINGSLSSNLPSPQLEPVQEIASKCNVANAKTETGSNGSKFENAGPCLIVSSPNKDENTDKASLCLSKDTGASVQVLKKPSRAFGALLGNSASKRKFDSDKKEQEVVKLEQIRSSVNLPFHSFAGSHKQEEPIAKAPIRILEPADVKQPAVPPPSSPAASSKTEEIIMLEDDQDVADISQGNLGTTNRDGEDDSNRSALEADKEEEPMSLSDLSSSFQKCFQDGNNARKSKHANKTPESQGFLQLKPFDYEAARQQIRFGENPRKEREDGKNEPDPRSRKKGSDIRVQRDNGTEELRQGRRRQAFPASGNRSATFR